MALLAFWRIVCNIERVFARFAAHRLFFWYPAYRSPAILLVVSSYRPYGYPVRRISGMLPEPVLGGRFAGQKKYRVKSLWFSSSLSHTLTYFFSFYLQKYIIIYIVCIYILYIIILYASAREKYFVIQGSKIQ